MEEPLECIDWPTPWNPRADGYQSPAGSSSDSGVAIAAYDWLDIAIGSDTSGIGRRPGHWNGCFAMRPSHGHLSDDGLLKSFPRFDVPTFFGRELEKCKNFASAWYGNTLPHFDLNRGRQFSLIYPTDYLKLINNPQQLTLFDLFLTDLESTLHVQHQKLSVEELWTSSPPSEANSASLIDYMADVSRDSFFFADYHNFAPSRKDYREKFGKKPYISPPVRWQWNLASTTSATAHATALAKLEVCEIWFETFVMKSDQCNTIFVLPIKDMSPRYRDELPTKHFNPVGVPNLFLAPILKAPELTLPIGEVEYESRVSGIVGKLPIAVSLMGSHGQDMLLFEMALDCLRQLGRPIEVLARKTLFPPA